MNNKRQESVGVQIKGLDQRIKDLTLHLQVNPKDYSSQRGLYKILSKRKRLVRYLGF